MGQALYRKYRSKKLSEVVGQDHITATLERALKSGRISHAYLFTGPRGVGKTSVARILAHEVNKLAYVEDTIHLDIIEIDAASNRRIDEVRDLREKVHIAPTSAKFKVYIIDEVHMLTKEAFNALLKTLEEPPDHCIFILATTEFHKLPETIVSRTQRFNFRAIGKDDAVKHLGNISKKEKINIDKAALELLADHSHGSFRDSISLLDQLTNLGGKVTEQVVRDFLGLPSSSAVAKLVESLKSGDSKRVLQLLDDLRTQGVSAEALASDIGYKIRQDMLETGTNEAWFTGLLKELLEIPSSHSPDELLEISLLNAADNPNVGAPKQQEKVTFASTSLPRSLTKGVPVQKKARKDTNIQVVIGQWDKILEKSKSKASIYTALRLAVPQAGDDGELILKFKFSLHQKKLMQAHNVQTIERFIKEATGEDVIVKCEVSETDTTEITKTPPKTGVENISNIFGAAEVLES